VFYNTNSFIIEDKVIFRDLSKSGYAAVGFKLKPIDIKNAKTSIKNHFGEVLASLLKSFRSPFRYQIKFSPDSEFTDMLGHYDQETKNNSKDESEGWCSSNRDELIERYSERMEKGFLKKETAYIFIALPIQSEYSSKEIEESANTYKIRQGILNVLDVTFKGVRENLRYILSSIADFDSLDSGDLKVLYKKFYNKSLETVSRSAIIGSYDESVSIESNCYQSDYVGFKRTHKENYAGFGDHLYHDFLVIEQFPESFDSDATHQLTNLDIIGYDITVNIKPVDRRSQLARLERVRKTKKGQNVKDDEQGLSDDISIIQEKISRLKHGEVTATSLEYIIHVWSSHKDELIEKIASISSRLDLIGFQYFQPDMAAQFKGFLSRVIPGWLWSSYSRWTLEADSDDARLLPISASFSGFDKPEILFDSEDMGIVGLKNNFGVSFPQHTIVLAATGAGKSALICNYLTQAWDTYSFINIVDIGDSYRGLAAIYNVDPIIFHPNHKWTLNFFDTLGAPLESSHKNFISMFLRKLMGDPLDPQEGTIQGSYVMHYVEECYRAAYDEWALDNPFKVNEVAAYYIATIKRKKKSFESPEITIDDFLDTYHQVKNSAEQGHEQAKELYDAAVDNDDDITRVISEAHHKEMLQNISFMWFERSEFPTLTRLLNRMISHTYREHDQALVKRLSSLLVVYQRGGQYGGMFDGSSNVPLQNKLVYFDLDKLNSFLRSIVIFLINSSMKNYITSMPRDTLKLSLIEELFTQAKIEGAESAYEDQLNTGRKYGWQFMGVLQSWNQVADTKFGKILLTNVAKYLIGKQESIEDLEILAEAKKIPKTICESIVDFKYAHQHPADDRYTNFAYIHGNEMGICRNYCNSYMLWVSEFGGSSYNEKLKQLESCENALEAIKKYA
jgi:type IV secretion system protein TrbE